MYIICWLYSTKKTASKLWGKGIILCMNEVMNFVAVFAKSFVGGGDGDGVPCQKIFGFKKEDDF